MTRQCSFSKAKKNNVIVVCAEKLTFLHFARRLLIFSLGLISGSSLKIRQMLHKMQIAVRNALHEKMQLAATLTVMN